MKTHLKCNMFSENKTVAIITVALVFIFVLVPVCFLIKFNEKLAFLVLFFILAPIIGYLIYFFIYSTPPLLLLLIGKDIQNQGTEIAKLEASYLSSSKKTIIKELGVISYLKSFGGMSKGLNTGIELCTKLIKSTKVESNERLKFHFLIRLYKAYLLDDQYQRAYEQLKLALKIQPENILLNYWLAEIYETLDKPESAIKTYETVQNLNIPLNLKYYIQDQIDRVIEKGPRTPPPVPGLKYMPY